MSGHARSRGAKQLPRIWLLDFDNTLARLEPEVDWAGGRRALEPYLRSVGAPGELFERFPRGNLPLYDAYRTHLIESGASPAIFRETLRHASRMIEKIELAGVDRAKPLEGALDLLGALRASSATLAIVTSNSSRTVERWLKLHGVNHPDLDRPESYDKIFDPAVFNSVNFSAPESALVDAIVGRDSLLALKPAPDSVQRALELFAGSPADAAFVGDSEADLLAASRASVKFYGVASTDAARDRLRAAGATEIFASPAALAIHLNLSAGS